jgi:hypothetical protein
VKDETSVKDEDMADENTSSIVKKDSAGFFGEADADGETDDEIDSLERSIFGATEGTGGMFISHNA